jgi:hypothetical protein
MCGSLGNKFSFVETELRSQARSAFEASYSTCFSAEIKSARCFYIFCNKSRRVNGEFSRYLCYVVLLCRTRSSQTLFA